MRFLAHSWHRSTVMLTAVKLSSRLNQTLAMKSVFPMAINQFCKLLEILFGDRMSQISKNNHWLVWKWRRASLCTCTAAWLGHIYAFGKDVFFFVVVWVVLLVYHPLLRLRKVVNRCDPRSTIKTNAFHEMWAVTSL